MEFFRHFLNKTIMNTIVNHTNNYHNHMLNTQAHTPNARIHAWYDTCPEEMYVFYAVSMLMTRNRHLTIEEHWSADPLLNSKIFGQTMVRDRYELILQMLHYSDTQTPTGDRLYKVRSLLDHCRKIFKETMLPNENLCIDESIIVFKGRLIFKQFIPSKRHRFGIKLFVICDVETGYILDFIIYCGVETEICDSELLGISGAVVTTLMKDYFGKGHKLFCDNWYSSPELFQFLHKKKTNACGTVRKTRKSMPKFDKLKKGQVKSLNRGPLLVLKWHDRREVHMISTMHDDSMVPTEKINRATGQPFIKPQCVVDYNKNMGTVDKADMMLSSLSCMRKSLKWYKKVGFHIIDLFLLNSSILYKVITGKKISLAEFQLNVIRQLIETYGSASRPSTSQTTRVANNPKRILKTELLRHLPHKIPPTVNKTKPYRRCRVCIASTTKDKKRKMTNIMCEACDVALCSVPCFYDYHDKINF
jgi:hypothetical protein